MKATFNNTIEATFFLESSILQTLEEVFSSEAAKPIKGTQVERVVRGIVAASFVNGIRSFSQHVFEAMEADGLIPQDGPPLQTLYLLEGGLAICESGDKSIVSGTIQ